MKLTRASAPAIAALVAACAGVKPQAELPPDQTFEASLETVRAAVLTTLEELELVIESESASDTLRLIRTTRDRFDVRETVGQYMYCGQDILGRYTAQPGFRAEQVLNLRITRGEIGTVVRVRATFYGRTDGRRYNCASLGKHERELLEALAANLN